MPVKVIRIADLASTQTKAGLLPVSRATIWRWVREGRFPKPFKLSESVTVWDAAAVESFIATRAGGAGATKTGSRHEKLQAAVETAGGAAR